MEYGGDNEYLQMAAASIEGWRKWNVQFEETLFHEVGFLLLTRGDLDSGAFGFERKSWENLSRHGYDVQRLNATEIGDRYPAFNNEYYVDGIFHAQGGYAEASKTIVTLTNYAVSQGIVIHQGQTVKEFVVNNSQVSGVLTKEGLTISSAQVVVCAGNFTPYLLPELKPYFKVTAHPVFHLKPSNPTWYRPPHCPVFGADISNTGWYGFPYHPTEKVIKIGRHGPGLDVDPRHDPRVVSTQAEQQLKAFLEQSIPGLAQDPMVQAKLCCYTDTLDGHYWIDRHPEIEGLTVGSGGSGHGFKMAPIIGDMIATTALGESHIWSDRYQWRELSPDTEPTEEARSRS